MNNKLFPGEIARIGVKETIILLAELIIELGDVPESDEVATLLKELCFLPAKIPARADISLLPEADRVLINEVKRENFPVGEIGDTSYELSLALNTRIAAIVNKYNARTAKRLLN